MQSRGLFESFEIGETPVPMKVFAAKYPGFSEASIRFIYFHTIARKSGRGFKPANGFAPAFRRIGRRIFVVPKVFFQCMHAAREEGRRG